MSATVNDMIDFIAERCTPEKDAEIRAELAIPGSFARRFIDAWAEDAHTAYDVDWNQLLADDDSMDATLEVTAEDVRELMSEAADRTRAGDLEAALALRHQACDLAIRVWGEEDRETATCLNALGKSLYSLKRYAEAATAYDRALAIRSKVMGENHTDTGINYAGLGRVHEALGDYLAAVRCHERALAIMEAALGKGHPDTGVSLTDLGCVLSAVGDHAAARTYHERALSIAIEIDGPHSANSAIARGNLACVFDALGDHATARSIWEETIAVMEKSPDTPELDRVWALNNLGSLLLVMGDVLTAKALLTKALGILSANKVEFDTETVGCLNNLGTIYFTQGEYAEASDCYERAVAVCEALFGTDHHLTLLSRSNLAATQVRLASPSDILGFAENWQRLLTQTLTKNHLAMTDGTKKLQATYFPSGGRTIALNLLTAA